jgi:2-polyprenyl-3-methyl-5-hydroxy-6-metoxy-1,4-benzoquinol methylase
VDAENGVILPVKNFMRLVRPKTLAMKVDTFPTMMSVDRIIRSADRQFANTFHSPGIELWISQVFKENPGSTKQVLDMGCGVGYWGYIIKSYVDPRSHIAGVDTDSNKLAILASTNVYDSLICADGASFCLTEGFFDSVISIEVLQGMPDFRSVLKSLESFVHDGGLIVLSQLAKSDQIRTLIDERYDVLVARSEVNS